MKTAVVLTVKNEARLLRPNLLYHLGLGIDRVFVYFDHTTDNGPETIADLKNVQAQNSVSAEQYSDLPFLKKFWSNAEEHHTARQCLNTYDALQQCKQEGIDWLVSLDADELFITRNKGQQTLTDFFNAEITENYDVIRLPTLEMVNRKMAYQNVMAEETLFKKQKNFKSRFDRIYRKLYNPYTKKHITTSYWLGHTMGKAAINVHSDLIPFNVHRYQKHNGDKPREKKAGNILHYHLYDFEDFLKKYRNFKNRSITYLSGNQINSLKSLWIKLVNDPQHDKASLKNYYKKNIHYNKKELARLHKTRVFNILKRKEEAVVQITKPKEVLRD
ncbi:glycosyltransferase family 2 protein [Marixanthomonas spongiae]|uniref:glycosyltransferase family 2 protein n=1 Tax=Marixanthomonas spongiae TaxID=2174845 RepID=UPI0014038343|nr:glycosyltransferase family 2 protein [Marixanthomonas spongiae]